MVIEDILKPIFSTLAKVGFVIAPFFISCSVKAFKLIDGTFPTRFSHIAVIKAVPLSVAVINKAYYPKPHVA